MNSIRVKSNTLFYPGSKLDFKPIQFFIENTEVTTFYYCDYEVFQNHSIEFIQEEILRQIRPTSEAENEEEERELVPEAPAVHQEAEQEVENQNEMNELDEFDPDDDLLWEDWEALNFDDWEDLNFDDLEDLDFDDLEGFGDEQGEFQRPRHHEGLRDFRDYSIRYVGQSNPQDYNKTNWSEFFHENSGVNQEQIDAACIHVFTIYNYYRSWKLIYFGTEGIRTYETLLSKFPSIDIVVTNHINLNQHWQTFGRGSILAQLSNSLDKYPKHLLIGNGATEWKKFTKGKNSDATLISERLNLTLFNYNGAILLRELIRLSNVNQTKFHFIDKDLNNRSAVELVKQGRMEELLELNYRNSRRRKIYRPGEVSIGLVRVRPGENLWLLFHVGIVTQDLDRFEDVGYEFKEMAKFEKYFNRVIVRYPLRRQSKIRLAAEVFDDFEVSHLIPINFKLDNFS